MLLRHAEECGATVLEEHKVTEIGFESSDNNNGHDLRPQTANFAGSSGEKGSISFDYLVDASGPNGTMSTRLAFKLSRSRLSKFKLAVFYTCTIDV